MFFSSVASPQEGCMCSSLLSPSAVFCHDSFTQAPFFVDLVDQVRDFSIESQIEDLQSINQVWSFYLIYFLSGDVIGRVFPTKSAYIQGGFYSGGAQVLLFAMLGERRAKRRV
ncbi:uncharacterized protein DS421_20g684460 [Arachis hypogaea]|nr:uncharacterized protein DS421_20g684460 [Arachis hypogaea]